MTSAPRPGSLAPDPSPAPAQALWRIEHSGAVTAVGTSAWQSAASWVGLQKRFRKQVLPEVAAQALTLAACPEIAQQHQGVQRLACLLGAALADLAAHMRQRPGPSMAGGGAQLPAHHVLLVLPSGLSRQHCASLWHAALAELARWSGEAAVQALSAAAVTVAQGDNTAGFAALHAAPPGASQVLLAAVDSLLDTETLRQAHAAHALLTDQHRDGCIPGEAAACLWLHRVPDTVCNDQRHLVLHTPAVATNPGAHRQTEQEPDGQALAEVLRAAMAQAGWQDQHVGCSLSDLDGSHWRAQVHATAHARATVEMDALAWEPCCVTGQVGAATGPLHWALAAQRLWHEPQGPNAILSWALSPDTEAAAVALERTVLAPHAPAAR